jgi:hypothetical protein
MNNWFSGPSSSDSGSSSGSGHQHEATSSASTNENGEASRSDRAAGGHQPGYRGNGKEKRPRDGGRKKGKPEVNGNDGVKGERNGRTRGGRDGNKAERKRESTKELVAKKAAASNVRHFLFVF